MNTDLSLLRSEISSLRAMIERLFPEILSLKQRDWDTPARAKLRRALVDGELSARSFTRTDVKRICGTTDKRVDHIVRWALDIGIIERVGHGRYQRKAVSP